MTDVSLANFLDEWGDVLKAQVLKNMQPVYNPKAEDARDVLAREKLTQLLRKPFDAQIRKGILPVAKSIFKEDQSGDFMVGEMGTGKTLMALAVAFLSPKASKRIAVLCPGHLVRKWIREAKQTIPGCTIVNLNDKSLGSLVAEKLKPSKPKGIEIWVIGKERAKLHYQRKITFVKRMGNIACPDCGVFIEELRRTDNSPTCPECGGQMWQADRNSYRRFAKAEFIKRFLPNNFFDIAILDEVHELKGGGTAQGQAMSCLASRSRKVLALTGTLMGGYAKDLFFLLWRMYPEHMKKLGFGYGRTLAFAERYGVIERTYTDKENRHYETNLASIGKKMGRAVCKEVPGVSPLLLPDLLLERAAFIRLSDVSEALPEYDEIVVEVDMQEEQSMNYHSFAGDLMDETRKALAKGDMRLLGKMLQSLLAYPDGCRNEEVVTLERSGVEELIAYAPAVVAETLPKEERLIEILQSEKQEGRMSAIFLEHTGTRDLIPTLVERLKQKGFNPLVLRGEAVPPEKREEWLIEKVKTGEYDVLICNPNLVKTGLDLLDFPTIIFYQCGYSVYTLRQASRRSWRIGQDKAVRVFFMAYKNTMQERALSLMAAKMETSLAVEGELSDKGLAALSESENSIVFELAKALIGKKTGAVSVNEAWQKYRQRELASVLALDDDPVTTEEEVVVTSTTVITSPSGAKAHVKTQLIIRGKVYPKENGAQAYVDGHRFDLKDGTVFWNNQQVGNYDRMGLGQIKGKPIRIYRPQDEEYYVLAEIRA